MKNLPDSRFTGYLQPFSNRRARLSSYEDDSPSSPNTTLFKDVTEQEWKDGIGNDDAGGGISIASMNGFLSECSARQTLMDLGYMPGAFFVGGENALQMLQIPFFAAFPVKFQSDCIKSCGGIPVKTRWHRDCLIPDYSQAAKDSVLGYFITATALPAPGSDGIITGEDIICEDAGWAAIDCSIEGDSDKVSVWMLVSGEKIDSGYTPNPDDLSVLDYNIFSNGFQSMNMIPVNKNSYIRLYASVGSGAIFSKIWINVRVLASIDKEKWS